MIAVRWFLYLCRVAVSAPVHVWIVAVQCLGAVVGWLVDLLAALAGWPPACVLFARLARQGRVLVGGVR